MAPERRGDARPERGGLRQRGRSGPVRGQHAGHRGIAARPGLPAYADRELALLAAGRGSAHHRTRTSRKPAAARRPDGRRTPADAFEPSRRTFGRVFAHAVVLRHGERPFGPLSLDHAERHSGLDQQQRRRHRQSRQADLERRRIAPATDLQRQRQPCPREDRQGAAGGIEAVVPADAAQRRRRGQQRPHAVPVGPRQGGPPRAADRSAGARRGVDRTADAARLDHLPRSADRPAVAAFGTAVADRRPFRRNPGNREPLPGSRRRT